MHKSITLAIGHKVAITKSKAWGYMLLPSTEDNIYMASTKNGLTCEYYKLSKTYY